MNLRYISVAAGVIRMTMVVDPIVVKPIEGGGWSISGSVLVIVGGWYLDLYSVSTAPSRIGSGASVVSRRESSLPARAIVWLGGGKGVCGLWFVVRAANKKIKAAAKNE